MTPSTAPKIARLTGHAYYSLGAIEGYIQLVSVNPRARRFNITHSRTLKTIRCSFPESIEEDVFEAIKTRRKVIVTGRISYNAQNEPLSIYLSKGLRFLKDEGDLPSIEALTGSAPDITEGFSTEEFIRGLRDG